MRQRKSFLERRMTRFLREPPSIRGAAATIVMATTAVVIGGGIAIRSIDSSEYSSIWVGMWWALQTVTTVGYGDVTPHNPSGRVVASFVMLEGIAFLAIVTAAITSTFVAQATAAHDAAEKKDEQSDREAMDARFDELDRKIDRLEAAIRRSPDT